MSLPVLSQALSSAQPYPIPGMQAEVPCSAHSPAPQSAVSLTPSAPLKPIESKMPRTPVLTMLRPRPSNDAQQIIGAQWRPAWKAVVTAFADEDEVTYEIY